MEVSPPRSLWVFYHLQHQGGPGAQVKSQHPNSILPSGKSGGDERPVCSPEGSPRPTSSASSGLGTEHEPPVRGLMGGRLGALSAAGRAGRKPRLSPADLRRLEQVLCRGAPANGDATELWTLPRVAEVTERLTGSNWDGLSNQHSRARRAPCDPAPLARHRTPARLRAGAQPRRGSVREREGNRARVLLPPPHRSFSMTTCSLYYASLVS